MREKKKSSECSVPASITALLQPEHLYSMCHSYNWKTGNDTSERCFCEAHEGSIDPSWTNIPSGQFNVKKFTLQLSDYANYAI